MRAWNLYKAHALAWGGGVCTVVQDSRYLAGVFQSNQEIVSFLILYY